VSRKTAVGLSGGLDLTTPTPLTRPGTLADCLNYEVASRRGYTRIDGFERFDGRPGVAEFRILQLTCTDLSGLFAVRNRVQFAISAPQQAHEGITGYVTEVAPGSASTLISVAFAGGMGDPILPDTLNNLDTLATASCTSFTSLERPLGQQVDFDYALKQLAVARRAQIETVPGRPGSDILGGFLLRNEVYAIRDLPRVYFENGYYTDADEGLFITIGSSEHRILEVRVLGDRSGYIAYDPVPGSGTDAVGIGAPTLTSLPVTGSLDSAFTSISYADGLSVSGGVAPYFWSLAESDTGAPAPPEPGDLSDVVLQAEVTPAALWRSTSSGWERVDLGREMAFTNGTSGLQSTPRALNIDPGDVKVTAWTFAGTSEINATSAPNINADDGTTASLSGVDGQTIWCRNFNFSSVPDGAEIVGIEVRIERQSNVGNKAIDETVILTGISGGVDNKASTEWDTALTLKTYGSASDLWGSESITAAAVKDPSFGALFVVRRSNPANAIVATVDHVSVRVHYVERAGRPIYIWNGTSDVVATLINVQILEGDAGQSSASGYLTISAAANSAKPRLVRVGDQIRSAPSGGGVQLGLVASRDRPIFLPGQFEVDNNRSQYQWQIHNFFGQDRYAAAYGVSGAGPAMAFDGVNLIKVRTPLSPGQDVPRHIAKHGDLLMLGFFSGAVVHSAVGAPYEMRGAFGAGALEVGDRLTALTGGGGDALIIVCESSTYVLRGLSPSSFSRQTVSSRRGAIEYTLADPGKAIIADSFGLFAADTPESFEPASRQYQSSPVEPWLRERLQATISNEQRFIRPVAALAVRSKNQYRLFFRDGAVLTMTMGIEGIEITRQRLGASVGLPIRSVWSGIDASGRERLFCTFAGRKEGYVFELDVGRSFDGEAIPARIVINPMNFGAQSQLKKIDRMFVSGSGGYASLEARAGLDGEDPSGYAEMFTLGLPDQPATSQNGSRRSSKNGSFQMGRECYDISVEISSLTDEEAPHTLAYIEPYVTALGDSWGDTGA